jgi:DNA-binding response OmpR family regulator
MISILVVEDDLDVGLLLEHILMSAGYSVDRASTASDSRGLIASKAYDLVLADGVLPDGTGIEIADQAKARGMKALIITARMARPHSTKNVTKESRSCST